MTLREVGNQMSPPSFDDCRRAAARIGSHVFRTPTLRSDFIDERVGARLYFKPESLQITNAYKIRGALNFLLLHDQEGRTGIIAASAGNHGQGVAFAGRLLGQPVEVVVPRGTPDVKKKRMERLGALVTVSGSDFDESDAIARRRAREEGLLFVPAFDDPDVIAGQSTVAQELLAEIPHLDAIAVPNGGGGLTAGTAIAAKACNERIRIIAVEPEVLPSLATARKQGAPVCLPGASTIQDGIAVRVTGALTFQIAEKLVDDVVSVTDDEVKAAMSFAADELKLVLEGAGAASLAAVLFHGHVLRGCASVGVILSGGNVDRIRLAQVLGG